MHFNLFKFALYFDHYSNLTMKNDQTEWNQIPEMHKENSARRIQSKLRRS